MKTKPYIKEYLTSIFAIILIITIAATLYYALSFKQSIEIVTNNIKNELLIGDFKDVQFKLNQNKNIGFESIYITDSSNKTIISNSTKEKSNFSIKLYRNININNQSDLFSFRVFFIVSSTTLCTKLFVFNLIGIILTIPLFFFLKEKHYSNLLKLELKEKEDTMRNLVFNFSHDIKSPLAILKSISNQKSSHIELDLLNDSIARIEAIAEHVLHSRKLNIKTTFDLNQTTHRLVKLKEVECNYKIIYLNSIDHPSFVFLNQVDFERQISNLINNAIEASNGKDIVFKISELGDFYELSIIDKGVGIPKKILKYLGTSEITTKEFGNGIGLKKAFDFFKNNNSEISISSTENIGTEIQIKIPVAKPIEKNYVLLDNDELTRMNWEITAKKRNVPLRTFSSASDLMSALDQIPKDTLLYIDSDLGNAKGEEIARDLFHLGYQELYMCTGHSADKFTHLTFLKDVISKTPPF